MTKIFEAISYGVSTDSKLGPLLRKTEVSCKNHYLAARHMRAIDGLQNTSHVKVRDLSDKKNTVLFVIFGFYPYVVRGEKLAALISK